MGVVLFMALSPFAYAYTSFGPQPYNDVYFYFGDDSTPQNTKNGITLDVDGTSISYQSVKATVKVDHGLIDERNITRFSIMANQVVVGFFEVSYDSGEAREWYSLDMDISDKYIGSDVYFQIVGIEYKDNQKFVVAWSQESPTYHFKPLPVIDRDAIDILNQILEKLEEMRAQLAGKLDALKSAVEKIYTVTPETQEKFNNALENLKRNLPTEQIKEQTQQMKNTLDESVSTIENTEQPLKFGEFNWMGTVTTPLYDFTAVAEQVELIRRMMQIFIWCEFIFFVIVLLRPTLTV